MKKLILTSLLCAGAITLNAAPTKEAAPANVILILIDDQSWVGTSLSCDPRDISASKSDFFETPQLAKLATDGMTFVSGYSSAAMCTPSRYALEYGQTAARLRVTQNGHVNYPGGSTGIAQMLKAQKPEYISHHYGKWGIEKASSPEEMGYAYGERRGNDYGSMADPDKKIRLSPDNPKRTPEIAAKGVKFLEERAADKRPFFLYLSFFAVHQPVQATEEMIAKYKARHPGMKHADPAYAAMTEEVDQALGQVRAKLAQLGLDKNTYIIYTSDNGGQREPDAASLNFPLRDGKNSLWEGGVRVPFVVAGPGVKPGAVSLEPVINYDLLPTIAEITGATPPANLDGGSLLPILKSGGTGKVNRSEAPGLVWHMPFHHSQLYLNVQSAIRIGNYKYLRDWNEDTGHLFNVDTDFREQYDLSAQMPAKAKELEAALMAYLKKVGAEDPKPDPANLNKKTVVDLRAAQIRNSNALKPDPAGKRARPGAGKANGETATDSQE